MRRNVFAEAEEAKSIVVDNVDYEIDYIGNKGLDHLQNNSIDNGEDVRHTIILAYKKQGVIVGRFSMIDMVNCIEGVYEGALCINDHRVSFK